MSGESGIALGPTVMQDQREVLQEQFGVPEDQAEELYTNVKTNVMLSAQEADKDLSDSEINAITNVLVAQLNANAMEQQHREQATMFGLSPSTAESIQEIFLNLAYAAIGVVIGVNLVDGTPILSVMFIAPILALVFSLALAFK